LCSPEAVPLTATIVVERPAGETPGFNVCDWCGHAIRRLAITARGQALFEIAGAVESPLSLRSETIGARVEPPVLVVEFPRRLEHGGGRYVVRVLGRESVDGAWEGSLEIVAVGAARVLQTGPETSRQTARISPIGPSVWIPGSYSTRSVRAQAQFGQVTL
jgi:hypothetical protein